MAVGRIHSFQSMGTLDGPGVRFVVFTQGCNLRCGCCHNPDTWLPGEGREYTAEEIAARVARYKDYFGQEGGVTVSGGEPLLQADFVRELFCLCRAQGIHTCLDTSGSLLTPAVHALLDVTDRVLLDVKYITDELYRRHAGCSLDAPLRFLGELQARGIPTTLRQVIIPTLNDSEENILALREIAVAHSCVDRIELLPFRKICQVKYDRLGWDFPFAALPEPSPEAMTALRALIPEYHG